MGATKIINVSKSDSFDEVFDLFKNTSAEEVIFIFPKNSKFSKQESYFGLLKKEADKAGKTISVMAEDRTIADFAHNYGIALLAGPKPAPALLRETLRMSAAKRQASPDDSDEESPGKAPMFDDAPAAELAKALESKDEDQEKFPENEYSDNEPSAILTSTTPYRRRSMDDIVKSDPEEEFSPSIKDEDKKPVEIEIRKAASNDGEKRMDKIERIWATASAPVKKRKWKISGSAFGKFFNSEPISKKASLAFIGVGILVIFFIVYSYLNKTTVSVTPAKKDVSVQMKVTASPNFNSVSEELNRIPGQKFSVQKEVSDTFQISGQKDSVQKASGKITIVSTDAKNSQRLVATTRFQTADGLIFRIPQTITVPAAKKSSDGKIVPGTVDSTVFADRPGPEFNIGPTKFTIPGFSGKPQFDQFSAFSTSPMTGGIIGPSKAVTEDDFVKAQTALDQKLKDEIAAELKNQIAGLRMIEQNSVKIAEPTVNAKVGDAAPDLEMKISGGINIVAFRDSDVWQLVDAYLFKKVGFHSTQDQIKINFKDAVYNEKDGSLSFNVSVDGVAVADLDKDKIASDIAGMGGDQLSAYFRETRKDDIAGVKISFSSFWVSTMPKDPQKIKIEIGN